jgi:hypothetical protein
MADGFAPTIAAGGYGSLLSQGRQLYFATRFNSAVSVLSASAKSTPPHSVMRSGMTMRLARG